MGLTEASDKFFECFARTVANTLGTMLLRWNGSLVDEFCVLDGYQIPSDRRLFPLTDSTFAFGGDSHAGRSLRNALNFLGPDFWDFGNSSFR
jgi:hypothetical protein